MSDFKIEKNVPFTGKQNGKSKYPFADMKVGDSFFVNADPTKVGKIRNTIISAANNFKRLVDNKNLKFVSTKLENGIRIWRIA